MKSLLYTSIATVTLAATFTTTGCRVPPPTDDGDTVAASVFEPEDTAVAAARRVAKQKVQAAQKDSNGIYYIGSGSTRAMLQLVSYPSRRDTIFYSKTRHVKVKGSAAIGNVVRVGFYLFNGRDSLVNYVEQLPYNGLPQTTPQK